MTKKQEIKLFEERRVRSVWDSETEEWYFAVVDVVEVLTDSVDPSNYIKNMKRRDPEFAKGWCQIVTPLSIVTAGGKQRVNCATAEGLLRIIQSIPSPKAEPFKRWIAQVAAERLNQMQDPERSIEVRKELTDEWKRGGIDYTRDFASLTEIILQQWSGKASDYLLPNKTVE